jgi:hypothetical protein
MPDPEVKRLNAIHLISSLFQSVRFFVTDLRYFSKRQWRRQVVHTGGDEANGEGARPLEGFGGMPPEKNFVCRVSKTLFPAFSGKFYDNLKATHRRFLL